MKTTVEWVSVVFQLAFVALFKRQINEYDVHGDSLVSLLLLVMSLSWLVISQASRLTSAKRMTLPDTTTSGLVADVLVKHSTWVFSARLLILGVLYAIVMWNRIRFCSHIDSFAVVVVVSCMGHAVRNAWYSVKDKQKEQAVWSSWRTLSIMILLVYLLSVVGLLTNAAILYVIGAEVTQYAHDRLFVQFMPRRTSEQHQPYLALFVQSFVACILFAVKTQITSSTSISETISQVFSLIISNIPSTFALVVAYILYEWLHLKFIRVSADKQHPKAPDSTNAIVVLLLIVALIVSSFEAQIFAAGGTISQRVALILLLASAIITVSKITNGIKFRSIVMLLTYVGLGLYVYNIYMTQPYSIKPLLPTKDGIKMLLSKEEAQQKQIKQIETEKDITHPKFSSFNCIGGNFEDASGSERSCHFTDVCLDKKSKRIHYYTHPKDSAIPTLIDETRSELVFGFPDSFIRLPGVTGEYSFAPVITKSEIPTNAKYLKPYSTVLYTPFMEDKVKHFINDDIFSVFAALYTFNLAMDPDDVQLLVTSDCDAYQNQASVDRCKQLHSQWLPAITGNQLLNINATTPDVEGEELVCFSNLIVGLSHFMYYQKRQPGFGRLYLSFRNHILETLGLDPLFQPKYMKIVITDKHGGRRRILNVDKVAAHLRRKFPYAIVDIRHMDQFILTDAKEQLRDTQQVTVLISPPGGCAMSSLFLPKHAVAIFSDYYSVTAGKSKSLEGQFWTNHVHLKHIRYPVKKEEVELDTSVASDGVTEEEKYRDWGSIEMNLDRIETIVRFALRHIEVEKGKEL